MKRKSDEQLPQTSKIQKLEETTQSDKNNTTTQQHNSLSQSTQSNEANPRSSVDLDKKQLSTHYSDNDDSDDIDSDDIDSDSDSDIDEFIPGGSEQTTKLLQELGIKIDDLIEDTVLPKLKKNIENTQQEDKKDDINEIAIQIVQILQEDQEKKHGRIKEDAKDNLFEAIIREINKKESQNDNNAKIILLPIQTIATESLKAMIAAINNKMIIEKLQFADAEKILEAKKLLLQNIQKIFLDLKCEKEIIIYNKPYNTRFDLILYLKEEEMERFFYYMPIKEEGGNFLEILASNATKVMFFLKNIEEIENAIKKLEDDGISIDWENTSHIQMVWDAVKEKLLPLMPQKDQKQKNDGENPENDENKELTNNIKKAHISIAIPLAAYLTDLETNLTRPSVEENYGKKEKATQNSLANLNNRFELFFNKIERINNLLNKIKKNINPNKLETSFFSDIKKIADLIETIEVPNIRLFKIEYGILIFEAKELLINTLEETVELLSIMNDKLLKGSHGTTKEQPKKIEDIIDVLIKKTSEVHNAIEQHLEEVEKLINCLEENFEKGIYEAMVLAESEQEKKETKESSHLDVEQELPQTKILALDIQPATTPSTSHSV